jgi:hypothetical protein
MSDNVSTTNSILAVITLKDNSNYVGGGAPIIYVKDEDELE